MAAVFVWTKRAGRVESGQRMIDCLKSVIYGFLIGIANIIPGAVSYTHLTLPTKA